MIIRINDPKTGKAREYRVRSAEEITIAEWVEIVAPIDIPQEQEMDYTIELIRRWVKIPKPDLLRLSMSELNRLASALGAMMGEVAAKRTEAFKPEPTFTWDGVTYTVPQNLEADTIVAQWVDINTRVEGMTEDIDLLPTILSYLLVEEGKEYDGSVARKRVEAFKAMPIQYALGLSAFFLKSGKQLLGVMNLYMTKRLTFVQQLLQQVQTASNSGTDGSASSSD